MALVRHIWPACALSTATDQMTFMFDIIDCCCCSYSVCIMFEKCCGEYWCYRNHQHWSHIVIIFQFILQVRWVEKDLALGESSSAWLRNMIFVLVMVSYQLSELGRTGRATIILIYVKYWSIRLKCLTGRNREVTSGYVCYHLSTMVNHNNWLKYKYGCFYYYYTWIHIDIHFSIVLCFKNLSTCGYLTKLSGSCLFELHLLV